MNFSFARPLTNATRYTLFAVVHMCVKHMRVDFYVVSAAAARLDDIKCVAPIFNGISLLFFLACFLVAPDGSV